MSSRRFLPALLVVSLAGCNSIQPQPQPPTLQRVVIVGTTDLHGRLAGHDEKFADDRTDKWRSGGLDVFGGYLANLRAGNSNVIVVDSGDLYQGTLESNLSEGASVIDAYNVIGFTAVAVGNHEFDFGPVGPRSTPTQPGEDPLGAMKRNAARARFPFLAANMKERATGQTPAWARPHVVVEMGRVRVGIIGLITEETPTVTNPVNVESLVFTDAVAAVKASAAELRAQGADAIIVIAHIGGECKELQAPDDVASCKPDSPIFKIAKALAPGTVSAIFGGHTHQQVRHYVNGIAIVQAAALGRGFSVVELEVDPAKRNPPRATLREHVSICERTFASGGCNPRNGTGALAQASYEGKPVVPSAAVAAVLDPVIRSVETKRREKLPIRLSAPFTREYRNESALGNLLADALRADVQGVDFAFINSGGIRADLKGPEVTFGEIFEVLPFDNFATRVALTGRQIQRLFELTTGGEHGALQVSGLRVIGTKVAGSEKLAISVTTPDGKPLDPDRVYSVATLDFLASGGGGLGPVMSELSSSQKTIFYDRLIRDVAIDQLSRMSVAGPLQPKVEGRLVFR